MKNKFHAHPGGLALIAVASGVMLPALTGCGPNYRYYRMEGQNAMLREEYAPARHFFLQAEHLKPQGVFNLNDLGVCSLLLARDEFERGSRAAAMRELDEAVAYFTRAIDAHPGHQAALEGKNRALELKGQFDQALSQAEWAATFVGPSARQQLFLARELEERGDLDSAFLRYRQAVAMEPQNPEAHVAFARFLLRHDRENAAVYHLQAAYGLDPRDKWVIDRLVERGALPPLGSPERP